MIVLLNLIPIIIHTLLFVLFKELHPGDFTVIEIIYNAVVTPLYLVLINKPSIFKHNVVKFILLSVIIIFNVIIAYVGWAIRTNNLWQADFSTVHLLKIDFYIGEIMLVIGWTAKSILLNKNRKE